MKTHRLRTKADERRYLRTYENITFENIKPKSITDHPEYVIFRESHKDICTRDRVADFIEYRKLVNAFFNYIGEIMCESSEGVFIEGFGYFGVLVYSPVSFAYHWHPGATRDILLNYHSDGLMFSPIFIPVRGDATLRTFTFDYTFSVRNMKKKLSKKIFEGKKYRFNACPFILNKVKTNKDD